MAHQSHNIGDLRLAFLLNLGFAILEIIGGFLINSVAILSDAVHDFGDSLSLGLAWLLQSFSNKESDTQFSYGYRRFSLLGALINAIVLTASSLFILSEAVQRLMEPESFSAPGMIAFAIVGVAVNGFAAYRLHDDKSSNAQVIGLHLLEDVLGWVAVLIVGVISLFVDLPILDPILSILITAYILYHVISRLWQAGRLFLQGVPEAINLDEIHTQLSNIEGVQGVHHAHVWSLDGEHNVFTAHLVVENTASTDDVIRVRQAGYDALDDLNVEHITIAVEYEREHCPMR